MLELRDGTPNGAAAVVELVGQAPHRPFAVLPTAVAVPDVWT
jgi:hypothetical protein